MNNFLGVDRRLGLPPDCDYFEGDDSDWYDPSDWQKCACPYCCCTNEVHTSDGAICGECRSGGHQG